MPLLERVMLIDAYGGPAVKKKEIFGEEETPTRSGRFVIALIEKHVTFGSTYPLARVPWGTPMRLNKAGAIEVQLNSGWKKLRDSF